MLRHMIEKPIPGLHRFLPLLKTRHPRKPAETFVAIIICPERKRKEPSGPFPEHRPRFSSRHRYAFLDIPDHVFHRRTVHSPNQLPPKAAPPDGRRFWKPWRRGCGCIGRPPPPPGTEPPFGTGESSPHRSLPRLIVSTWTGIFNSSAISITRSRRRRWGIIVASRKVMSGPPPRRGFCFPRCRGRLRRPPRRARRRCPAPPRGET